MSCYTSPDDGREMVRCDHTGCDAFTHFGNAQALGWDWFCGWLPKARHFCKKHATSDQFRTEFARSRERKPTDG